MKKKQVRLSNPQDIRRLIQRCITALLDDEMKTDKARCITYMGQVMLNCFEKEDLEKRIKELESRMQ